MKEKGLHDMSDVLVNIRIMSWNFQLTKDWKFRIEENEYWKEKLDENAKPLEIYNFFN